MILFLFRRQFLAVFSLVFCFSQMSLVIPDSAYAGTSWAEILKPLVKDVIVPGASAGMKKLIEKKMKVKLDNPSDVSTTPGYENVMTMPEESSPISGPEDGGLLSMPEEPTYSASSDNDPVGSGSLSNTPPPPVETP